MSTETFCCWRTLSCHRIDPCTACCCSRGAFIVVEGDMAENYIAHRNDRNSTENSTRQGLNTSGFLQQRMRRE